MKIFFDVENHKITFKFPNKILDIIIEIIETEDQQISVNNMDFFKEINENYK